MDHAAVAQFWNANAAAWTALARAGYDLYRDHLNTPAFFAMLPDVQGRKGLDIGCGEGHNTRLLAQRGASMHAIDIADVFVQAAQATEHAQPLGIDYQVASALALPFADAEFDFATAFMSLMDVPDFALALQEAHRVLKPGGFLQFSITHPCFDTALRKNLRDAEGKTYAIAIGDYFRNTEGEIQEWIFGAAPEALSAQFPKFKIPRFTHTLSEWLNAIIEAGFVIEAVQEPKPDDAIVAQYPHLQDAQVVSYFLQIRARKG